MILYEDKEILVCHKSAGMPVQSASVRQKDMVSVLRNHLDGGEVYVVHRLDQPVEGVVVFAKTKAAAADLSRQMADGHMKKVYQAVVELPEDAVIREASKKSDNSKAGKNAAISEAGKTADCSEDRKNRIVSEDEWHTLVDYLVKDGRNNRSFVADSGRPGAKRAELRYRILKWWEEAQENADGKQMTEAVRKLALAEIELMTGRHHQIRVQMAHAGLPLAGDRKYNPRYAESAKNGSVPGCSESLALCAVSLTFRHPSTKKRVTFEVRPQFAVNMQV
ncbi:MAG: RluA family pseudouridine synthase [Lachnospiraceae bacterium]|nr:RluA family pseudouridine synthase [Lachnospiraceae bacterium]